MTPVPPIESAVGARTEELVLHLLVQLTVVLATTRIVVALARRYLRQTDVAGEVLAGIVLGPSLLGAVAPHTLAAIFTPDTASAFSGIAQIGLVLLMFQIGQEFEFKRHLEGRAYVIFAVSAAGLAVPFALGFATAPWFYEHMTEPRPLRLAFQLFFAMAMSITAVPILGRIFMELRLSHTRTAALTIGAAAIDDVTGWLLLGVISAIARARFESISVLLHLGGLTIYLAIVFFVARPIVQRLIRRHMAEEGQLRVSAIAPLLLLLFVSGAITSALGVFAIIGGFAIGVALHDDRRFVEEWKERVAPVVYALFLPVFFAYTGLRTDIGTLGSAETRLDCALVCLIAFVGKFGGTYLAARATGEPHRSALAIGTCMNTRALMELVALNVGYDLGILPRQMFTMLVIMAVLSTYVATPIIRVLMAREMRAPETVPAISS